MALPSHEKPSVNSDSVWNDDLAWGYNSDVEQSDDELINLPGFVKILPPVTIKEPKSDKDWA